MMVQVYLTLFLIFALVAGGLIALFGRPFLRRWQEETRQEEYQKECALREKAQREEALKEVARWCDDEPSSYKETPCSPPENLEPLQKNELRSEEKRTK